MKRLITTVLLLLAAGSFNSIQAQKRQYADDIYGSKTPSESYRDEEPRQRQTERSKEENEQRTYSSSGNTTSEQRNNTQQYRDEYYDSEDDYYYSSRINRFYYPFYDRPYWSSFYSPYWYDPYWVDPYCGWSPWMRPGISISFGYGPYWSSYWGWSSWYGSPYFGSYWSYPAYGYGGYYSGYWNGYYAGIGDAGYHYKPNVTYGPRYSLRPTSVRNSTGISTGGYNGFRTVPASGGMRNENAIIRNDDVRPAMSAPTREDHADAVRNDHIIDMTPRTEDRAVRNGWHEAPAGRNSDVRSNPESARPDRQPWVDRSPRYESPAPARSNEAPRMQEQRSFQQPRYEQPRNESFPSRNFDRGSFGGGNNFGGGNRGSGGFGGGSIGGGHRR